MSIESSPTMFELLQAQHENLKKQNKKSKTMKKATMNLATIPVVNNLAYQLKALGEHREKILTSVNGKWLTVYLPNVGDGFKEDYLVLLDEKEKEIRKELETLGFKVD